MKGHVTTLVIVLVAAVILGVMMGSRSPNEGFENEIQVALSDMENDIKDAVMGDDDSVADSTPSNPATSAPATSTVPDTNTRGNRLMKELRLDETHIEEIREVLRDTANKVSVLEARANKTDETSSIDARQTRHIEELREVLSNTIGELRKDDILPGGSPCGCAVKPRINPASGMADASDGCRPPGWMRLMERENRRNQHCEDCPYKYQ